MTKWLLVWILTADSWQQGLPVGQQFNTIEQCSAAAERLAAMIDEKAWTPKLLVRCIEVPSED